MVINERARLEVSHGFNVSKVGKVLAEYKLSSKVKPRVIDTWPGGALKLYRVDLKGSNGCNVVIMYKVTTRKDSEMVTVRDIQISYDGDDYIMILNQSRECLPNLVLLTIDDLFNRTVNYHLLLTTEIIL